MKVAVPAGINSVDGVQPAKVEARESATSLAQIRTNIEGYRLLLTGGPVGSTNLGFDDLLVSINQAQLATDMIAAADNALLAVDAVPGTLEDAVVNNAAAVQALYDALKVISDQLKTTFISVLGLQAPMGAAGDND
jgi:predicted lipoprotein